MVAIDEIKSKYVRDEDDGPSLKVCANLSKMRGEIKACLDEITNFSQPQRDEWFTKWKNRKSSEIMEYKRQLKIVRGFIDEMDGMVSKAEMKLKEK